MNHDSTSEESVVEESGEKGEQQDAKKTLRELRAECRNAGIVYAHAPIGTAKDTPWHRIAGVYAPIEKHRVVILNSSMPLEIRRRIVADVLKVLKKDPQRPRTNYWLDSKGELNAGFDPRDYPQDA